MAKQPLISNLAIFSQLKARFSANQQQPQSQEEGNNQQEQVAQDLLDEDISFEEIRQNQLEKMDQEKMLRLLEIEHEIDIPYQLHGVQSKPEKKEVTFTQ